MCFAFLGFALAAFCVASVPLNMVDRARLAVSALFVSYTYLGAVIVPGLSGADRFSRITLYLTVAVVSASALVEKEIEEERAEEGL
jgi:hypothetical protein